MLELVKTKFQFSMFAHYKDTKGNSYCRNWGGFKVIDNTITRYSVYDLIFDFN